MTDKTPSVSDMQTVAFRKFPPPETISEEAKAFLRQDFDTQVFRYRPKETVEWQAIISALNLTREDAAKSLIRDLPVSVEEKSHSGVVYRVITPENQPSSKSGKVVMEFHGGAYVLFAGISGLARALKFSAASGYTVISVDYRMPPAFPHPAALEDALAIYELLLTTHKASDVGIFGTSAGANLAALLCLQISQRKTDAPGAVVMNTPCVDLSGTGDTFTVLEDIDPGLVTYSGVVEEALKLFAGGLDLRSPEISPLYTELPQDFPPALLTTGTRDLLLSDTSRFHMKLRKADHSSELLVFEGMWHAFSDVPEEQELYEFMARFYERNLV